MLIKEILEDFNKCMSRLEEVLDEEKNDIIRDSSIKRFELCFDLAWKVIKNYARYHAVECNSPRECVKTAFQLKLIDYDDAWLDMINDRNLSAHIYKEEHADKVYARLDEYLELFKKLSSKLTESIKEFKNNE